MIMNFMNTSDILQNHPTNPSTPPLKPTPSNNSIAAVSTPGAAATNTKSTKTTIPTTTSKPQKIQKKIRKESAVSSSSSTYTQKGTHKQQFQVTGSENQEMLAQLTSPSWSDKTVNLNSQTSSSLLHHHNNPQLSSKISINVSQNGQCFTNAPIQYENQQMNQQNMSNQQQLCNSKKKNTTNKISPRSQTSSLTSEISSFDLYSYNDCVGSSTSSTNQQPGSGMHSYLQNQNIINNNQIPQHHLSHLPPQSFVSTHSQDLPATIQQSHSKQINFSPIISPQQEPFQQIPHMDHLSHSASPKSRLYYGQNIIEHQSSAQKNHLNMNYSNTLTNNNSNNFYNNDYPQCSPKMQDQSYPNYSNEQENFIPNVHPSARLVNWPVLPIEIQRATYEMNGKIEEVQRDFDNCVPMIEIPYDKNLALQKVREAQQLQESFVYQLTNIRNGVSLIEAVENLKKNLLKKNNSNLVTASIAESAKSNKSTAQATNANTAGTDSMLSSQTKSAAPSKQKKISKKAPSSKTEKTPTSNLQQCESQQIQQLQLQSQQIPQQQQQVNEDIGQQTIKGQKHLEQYQQVVGQRNGMINGLNENGINNPIHYMPNSYNYLPDMQDHDISTKEVSNIIPNNNGNHHIANLNNTNHITQSYQNSAHSSQIHPIANSEYIDHAQSSHINSINNSNMNNISNINSNNMNMINNNNNNSSISTNQNMDIYQHRSNKNNILSPRKGALSMQGYDDEVMSQQELMNNQMNQYDDYAYQPKLRKFYSDPFGDFYNQNNNPNYMSSQMHPHHLHHHNHLSSNYINHSDNMMDGGLSVIYEEENAYYNNNSQHQNNNMATNFKKDDDDTLYGYVSQNDTIEDLINSQSKCKPNKSNNANNSTNYYTATSNVSNFVYGSTAQDDEMNNRVYQQRNGMQDSYYNGSIPPYPSHSNICANSIDNLELFSANNTKQRTSSVATTDLRTSQRKIDFETNYDGNHCLFNKNY